MWTFYYIALWLDWRKASQRPGLFLKNCCSKVYFLQKPVPHFAYFHRRIIHLVCFSPLCLIWEKIILFHMGFTLKVKWLLLLFPVICMFLLYLSQHINSNIGREIGPLVLERRRWIDFTVNNWKLFKSSVTLKVVHMPHVNLSEYLLQHLKNICERSSKSKHSTVSHCNSNSRSWLFY